MKIFQSISQISENTVINKSIKFLLLVISIVLIIVNYLECQEESVTFIYNNF